MRPARAAGFTLVELAMSTIIIGLLIAGVLMGIGMVQNARVKTTAAQYQKLSAGYHVFRDKYNAMPGDMRDALTRLPDCDGTSNCANGDGDGRLGTPVDSTTDVGGTPGIQENIQFWKHLALADIIEGVRADFSSAPGDSVYGSSHPLAAAGGGWNALTTADGGDDDEYGQAGLTFQISGMPNTNVPGLPTTSASMLDDILDDAAPNSGLVKAESTDSGCEDDAENVYLTAIGPDPLCVLYLRVP